MLRFNLYYENSLPYEKSERIEFGCFQRVNGTFFFIKRYFRKKKTICPYRKQSTQVTCGRDEHDRSNTKKKKNEIEPYKKRKKGQFTFAYNTRVDDKVVVMFVCIL